MTSYSFSSLPYCFMLHIFPHSFLYFPPSSPDQQTLRSLDFGSYRWRKSGRQSWIRQVMIYYSFLLSAPSSFCTCFARLFHSLSLSLSLSLVLYLFISLLVCLSVSLFVCLFVCLFYIFPLVSKLSSPFLAFFLLPSIASLSFPTPQPDPHSHLSSILPLTLTANINIPIYIKRYHQYDHSH